MVAYPMVAQTSYRPQMRPGLPGMISHETSWDVSTWIVATSAGIPFGVAVSASAGNPKQAVIGGSKFLGISVIDITQVGMPLDPVAGLEGAIDKYPQGYNMGVLTRGRIWVVAQADVAAGDAVYYEGTGGTLSNSASGTAAAGRIDYSINPAAGDTITLNGTAITFVASGATGSQVNIGANLGQTLQNLVSFINTNAASDVQVAKFQAQLYPPSAQGGGFGATAVEFGARTVGTAGNSLTLATTTSGATVTAMAGGTAAATAIPNSMWLDSQVAGDIARIALAIQV